MIIECSAVFSEQGSVSDSTIRLTVDERSLSVQHEGLSEWTRSRLQESWTRGLIILYYPSFISF